MARGEGAEQCPAALLAVKPLNTEDKTAKVRARCCIWFIRGCKSGGCFGQRRPCVFRGVKRRRNWKETLGNASFPHASFVPGTWISPGFFRPSSGSCSCSWAWHTGFKGTTSHSNMTFWRKKLKQFHSDVKCSIAACGCVCDDRCAVQNGDVVT